MMALHLESRGLVRDFGGTQNWNRCFLQIWKDQIQDFVVEMLDAAIKKL